MRISDWSSDVCSSDLASGVRSDGGRSSDRKLRSRQRSGGAGKARGGGGQGPPQGAARRAAPPESRQLTAMNRLVVLDCDVTLVDSPANIMRALDIACDIHRLPPPDPARHRRSGTSAVKGTRG